ncbi:PRC-barrel domain-containing protein [Microvirga sp. HBU67558]|uniref:PRC-barrel domain-containing protein n=1 Tax=Microvirga TaxID=186650 RepID=UPI001B378AF1|nr:MULTISPECIES: PRC-barrel domain-containing protein [unclassified Microvirga]MBQ0820813.1 PRC-barrel domain-containing protein [Microvirga sp. HBU67558]
MPTQLPNERQFREPGSMELDPSGKGIAIEETRRLIASSKVEGTPVFNRSGEPLGSVYNFMVDKISGQVAYVVMSFGGFLGIGESYHPLPWRALTYDPRLGGYVVDIDSDRLVDAPQYGAGEDPFTDNEYGARVDAYYKTTPTA